jgi:hypothetical protein
MQQMCQWAIALMPPINTGFGIGQENPALHSARFSALEACKKQGHDFVAPNFQVDIFT